MLMEGYLVCQTLGIAQEPSLVITGGAALPVLSSSFAPAYFKTLYLSFVPILRLRDQLFFGSGRILISIPSSVIICFSDTGPSFTGYPNGYQQQSFVPSGNYHRNWLNGGQMGFGFKGTPFT